MALENEETMTNIQLLRKLYSDTMLFLGVGISFHQFNLSKSRCLYVKWKQIGVVYLAPEFG